VIAASPRTPGVSVVVCLFNAARFGDDRVRLDSLPLTLTRDVS